MSSDQCAQNPDGSLKDAEDIQWFNDRDGDNPLPNSASNVQPLSRGLRNKTTGRLSDAITRKQLGSDEEDLGSFSQPPKRKRAARASKTSVPTLSSSNSFEQLLVEESSGDNESFKAGSGDESSGESTDYISNNEV